MSQLGSFLAAKDKTNHVFPLAALFSLAEKPHPAHQLPTAALYPGIGLAISNTATRLLDPLYDFRVGSRSTGKERDGETGLDYFDARYFSGAQGRFTSPDPSRLGAFFDNPQSWNMYAYAYNNPLLFVDRNGRWPTAIHEKIIDAAFQNLTSAQRQIFKDVSAHQDALLTEGNVLGGQTNELSYQHAMRAPDQSIAQAKGEYEDFLSRNEDAATKAQVNFWAAGNRGFNNDALKKFALALHAILDSTSPAHAGFQVWDWTNPYLVRAHTRAESSITPQHLNTAVTAGRNAFNTTFHPNFGGLDLLYMISQPQQTQVKSKICHDTDNGQVCQ